MHKLYLNVFVVFQNKKFFKSFFKNLDMLEIRFIKENKDFVKNCIEQRNQPEKLELVDKVIAYDEELRALRKEVDELRHKRNVLNAEIIQLKKQNKDISEKLKLSKQIVEELEKKEERLRFLEQEIKNILYRIPNILLPGVPIGKDETDNKVLRTWGKPKLEKPELPHGEILEKLGVADFKRAAKVSGAGFVYLQKELALLDLSLQFFAIEFLIKKGYMLVEPPFMIRKQAYQGVIDLKDFEDVLYKIADEDLYAIATAEHPLVAKHMNEILNKEDLPIKYVGFSPCFRKEIGSHGVDTKGLFRMHQFNKVEQVIFCLPEDSESLHEELLKNAEEMLQKLEIPYRVVAICSGDISNVAAKQYDIEAWFPREQTYKEVTSCSNCLSYQATRLGIKYKNNDKKEYVHTLNGTGIATSRTMRAIVENYYNKDGTISVPKVLQKYFGIKKIGG